MRSKPRLNQPKTPRLPCPGRCGFSMVAQSTGVKKIATSTDSAMAVAMVIENCR